MGHPRATERLVLQARPAQLALLRRHGETYPELRDAACAATTALRAADAAAAVLAAAEASTTAVVAATAAAARSGREGGDAGTMPTDGHKVGKEALAEALEALSVQRASAENSLQALAVAAAATGASPPCVCGARLGRVSYRERLVRCLRMRMPATLSMPDFEALVDRVLERREPCYFCDLCGESRAEGGVWTCENGNNTILHANAYDVCEKCFARHCSGVEVAAVAV